MPCARATILSLGLSLAIPAAAPAQDDTARSHLQNAERLLTAGDTSAALRELERARELEPDRARIHYELGRLYTRRASAVDTDFRDRKRAEEALLEAIRLDPDNPAYLLELGRLRIKQHMNTDARRVLELALQKAEVGGDPAPGLLSEIHYHLGWIQEVFYERQRDRRLTGPLREGIATGVIPAGEGAVEGGLSPSATAVGLGQGPGLGATSGLADYARAFLESAPVVEGSGSETARRMAEHYLQALRARPEHFRAATRVMLHFLNEGRVADYLALADRLVERFGEEPEAHLYRGLGLHVAGREEEAGEAFDTAQARFSEEERRRFLDLEAVMRRRAAERYRSLDPEARRQFESSYWQLKDPLYLTEANERRLEHLARVAYAGLRFTEPATEKPGWTTDRGLIWIRYGPPAEIARVKNTIVWHYGERAPAFMFEHTPGYIRTRFAGPAGDFRSVVDDYRQLQPASYANIPSIPEYHAIPVQIARFRGDRADRVAVEVHASLPLETLARDLDLATTELSTGFFLLDPEGRMIVRRTGTEVIPHGGAGSRNDLKSWRLSLPAVGLLVAAVEARDALTWRAAASRDTFTALAFPEDSLAVSDILLADDLRRLAPEPARRTELDILPSTRLSYSVGQPVHIYYELYGLEVDSESVASFDVEVSVRVVELHRKGLIAQFLGPLADAWGFSIAGDDRVELRYHREAGMTGRDRVVEYLSLDLKEAPPGVYEVRVRVYDRLTDRLAGRKRRFTVESDR